MTEASTNAPAPVRACDSSVLLDDLRQLCQVLGLPDGARPQSPHVVFQECLTALRSRLNPVEDEPVYSEGICSDGAAILKDGLMMRIEDVIGVLNSRAAPRPSAPEEELRAELARLRKERDELRDRVSEFREDVDLLIELLWPNVPGRPCNLDEVTTFIREERRCGRHYSIAAGAQVAALKAVLQKIQSMFAKNLGAAGMKGEHRVEEIYWLADAALSATAPEDRA